MLGARLEKLEKDLQLLSAMQNLLAHGSGSGSGGTQIPSNVAGIVRKLFEHPEKDTNEICKSKHNGSKSNNRNGTTVSKIILRDNCEAQQRSSIAHENGAQIAAVSAAADAELEKLVESENLLHQELRLEREKRNEIEEAAKRVAIKLQQTEDECERERDSKKALLVGTLHLKNQLQGYDHRINQLEIEVGNEKTSKFKILQDIEILNNEKVELKRHIDSLKSEFQDEKIFLQNENQLLMSDLKKSKEKLEQNCQESLHKEQNASQNEAKLRSQMSQFVGKCVQIDKERERLELELRKTITNAQKTEEELLIIREKLAKLQTEHSHEKILHDCIQAKSKSEMAEHRRQVETQIQSAHSLLTRTKDMIIQLKQERDSAQSALSKSEKDNQMYKSQLKILTSKASNFERNEMQARERIHALMTEKLEKEVGLEKGSRLLRESLHKFKVEKKESMRFLQEVKAKFLEDKKRMEGKCKNTEDERNKLKIDLTRLKENFQILQKISQDQTASLQKVKADLAQQTETKSELESLLRERDAKEISLTQRLAEEKRETRALDDQVTYLEGKLAAMEDDLKGHSCEDFVELTCKSKLVKIESELKSRYAEWQRSIESLKSERNEALAAARKATRKTEDARTESETQILETVSSCRRETAKLQAESQRLMSEKSAKIYELESELERVRNEATQSQRSLMTKIQQLQLALNICLSGAGATNPLIPATPSMSGSGNFGFGRASGLFL